MMKNNTSINENFRLAYLEVISHWPADDIFLNVNRYKNNDLYTVEGLYDLYENISEIFIGIPDELIKVTISYEIFSIIHKLSEFLQYINIMQLNIDSVYSGYERRISGIIVGGDAGWTTSDIELAYSCINK